MSKYILYPLRRLHGWLHDYPQCQRERYALKAPYLQKMKEYQKSKTPFVFLLLTPEHGNLGDHAIAYAETEILNKAGISYIEITGKQLYALKYYNLLGMMKGHLILINGGGNLGTLWMDAELLQREIIKKNPKSKILILPNTVYYAEDNWGHKELKKSIEIYNAHEKLTIYAREQTSYEFMKPIYKDVRLMPDMVMSLRPEIPTKERHGCLLCLRGDCEKTITEEQEQEIRLQAAALFGNDVADTDMISPGGVSVDQREKALQQKFAEFSGSKLVITDRLHGMIFCAITGTPCIVVDSKSPKVRGCYEWIKHLDYVRFADSPSQIALEYQQIPEGEHLFNNSRMLHYYDELAQVVKDYASN